MSDKLYQSALSRLSKAYCDDSAAGDIEDHVEGLEARITLLEALVKRRDRGMHTIGQHEQGCPGRYPSGRCICGHDDVAKYFKEQGG